MTTDSEKTGQSLKDDVVVPEVQRFEEWFSANAGTGLMPIERDILVLYLHARLSGKI